MSSEFFIQAGYQPRLENRWHDDRTFRDEWQDGVYRRARALADEQGLQSVLDVGCGSGFKLMKYFADRQTLGMELEPALSFVKQQYPERRWMESILSGELSGYDLAISADVIEHMVNPDILLDFLEASQPKLIVLSTPDRNLLAAKAGPPANTSHVREWSFEEFGSYVGSRFTILEHTVVTPEQATQMIVATLK